MVKQLLFLIDHDAGYQHIGASAIDNDNNRELYSEVFHQRTNEVENNVMRKMYRNGRRGHKRYRRWRVRHTVFTKTEGLAPSVFHKALEHIKLVNRVKKFLPISNIIIEVNSIDPKETKAKFNGVDKSTIDSSHKTRKELKSYIFFRDKFTCRVCGQQKLPASLHCHHIIFKSKGGSNQPENLATVCTTCHTPENHQKGQVLHDLMLNTCIPHFAGGYFMAVLTIFLRKHLEFEQTYGMITTAKRIQLGLKKEHYNDAFVIAGADKNTTKCRDVVEITKLRRNNRRLSRFHDAKYRGLDGKIYSGTFLNNGRISRNRDKDNPNMHRFRAHKLKKGLVRTRRQHYTLRPYDLVIYKGQLERVKSVITNGKYVALQSKKYPAIHNVTQVYHVNGNLYQVKRI